MKIVEKIKLGLLLGLSISIGTQILTWLGLGLTNMFVLLTYVLVVIFILYAVRKEWQNKKSSLSFLEVLVMVLIIIIVSRYVFQFYMFLYVNYFNPNWIRDVSEYWSKMLLEKGTPQEKVTAQIVAFQKAYQPINMFTIEIFRYGISQIVLGLIISLYFLFKNPK